MRVAIVGSISAALLLAALLLASCGAPVPTGTFRGSRDEAGRPGADPVVVAQLNRVILRIDAEGRADLEDGGIPWEGQVSRAGDRLVLSVEAVSGINVERQPREVPRTIEFRVISGDALDFRGVRLDRSTVR